MTVRAVAVDHSPVQVLDVGEGPAVLMLHGSGPGTTGAGAWAATAEVLRGSMRVVAPDQAGFGGTPLPPGSSRGGATTWVGQAAALMETLGVSSYAVVGHSMGGAVALALAAAHPDRVTHVVAVSTMGTPGAGLSPDLDAVWAAPPGPEGARDMLGRLLLDPSSVTDEAVAARARAMEAGAAAYAPLFPPPRERWVDDLAVPVEDLTRVRAPVLLVHGAQDTVTPLASTALPLLDLLASVRLHVLEQCGHVPAVEQPDAFTRALVGFLPSAG